MTKTERLQRTRTIAAYHEAGHAVAHAILCVPYGNTSIVRDEDTLGRVQTPSTPEDRARLTEEFYDRIFDAELNHPLEEIVIPSESDGWLYMNDLFSTLAGVAAQRHRFGKMPRGWRKDRDFESSVRIASMEDEESNAVPLDVPFAYDIINAAMKYTIHLIDSWWPYVEAVAAELLVKDELSNIEVRDIISTIRKAGRSMVTG